MSASVCVFCGQIKQGAFTPCGACARAPISEIDLAYSFALSTHCQTPETIREVAAEMQRGQPRPDLPPEQEEYVRQIARQWMESPLYQAVADHDKAKDTGDRYSISSSGIVEGSFTARDSSVQIARHAKNPLAVTRQMAFHALKSYGAFTSSEWEILTKAALNQSWVEKRGVSARYSHVYTHPENREAIFHETAIAEEYGYSDSTTRDDNKRPERAIFKLIDDGEMKRRCDKQQVQSRSLRDQHQPKGILRKLGAAYIVIGGLLATILWASNLWPLTWGSSQYLPQSSFYQRTIAIMHVQPVAVFYSVVRAFLWGPSLVVWSVDSHQYSFGKWLAPGLYAEEWMMDRRDTF